MSGPRHASWRNLLPYGVVVALCVLLLGWWLIFFSQQSAVLTERLARSGAGLSPEQVVLVREAADATVRMLLYEGGFLVVLLIAGVLLMVRSLRQEVRLHRERRDFLSAVTHELKSPIASARLYVESLQLARVPEHKRAHYLARAVEELDRLGRLADHLLDTARAASGRRELASDRLDLAAFARGTVERLAAEQPRVAVEIDAPRPAFVRADPDALETIVRNLFSNALKYGGDPPRVRVRVEEDGGNARLEVRDYGPGVRNGDARALFGPFVRGGDELVRSRPGVGLGLYLVAELTRALGGEVAASNAADGGGFAVRVSLPLAGGAGT